MQGKPALQKNQSDSRTATIEFASTSVCGFTEDQSSGAYVLYTGGIAGISDTSASKTDTEAFNRGANEIKFDCQ